MITLLRKLFDIRSGEGVRALLMFSYVFLLIASLMIVKPVRTSLFLSEFGASRLPLAYVLVAVVSLAFAVLYSKLARRIRLSRITAGTLTVSIITIGVVWSLLAVDYRAAWFIYGFYIWVAIYGLIITTQFWLLANYVFNAREAKRLFGFIGAGAISGGIFGGYLTKFLATAYGTAGILHFAMLFLVVCLVILAVVWKSGARATYRERLRRQAKQREIRPEGNPWRMILESRLASLGAAIVGIGVVTASLVDYQFNAVAAETFTRPDELTAFFGMWLSNLSIFSLLIQLFLTSRVLKGFGVGAALGFLPIAILLGASAVFILPGLIAVTALKVGEGGFKQSINKAGIELLALPIPARLKNQIKAFIDVTVDNLATGVGGLLLILMTAVLGLGVRSISLLILALVAGWIYLVIRVRGEYINAFRLAVENRSIDPEELTHDIKATVHTDDLLRLLESRNDKQLIFALGFFDSMRDDRIIPHLQSLIHYPSSEVRRKVFRIARLFNYENLDLTLEANRHVASGEHSVRSSAMRYLCSQSEQKRELILFYLQDDNLSVRAAALITAAREWTTDAAFRKQITLDVLFGELCRGAVEPDRKAETAVRVALAQAIGIVNRPEMHDCLNTLLNDPSPEVVGAAATSAGRTRDPRFINRLIELLDCKESRRVAREALSEYGESAIQALHAHLRNPSAPHRTRIEITRVLAMIGTRDSVDVLSEHLGYPDLAIRYEVIRALNRIRTRDPSLKVKSRFIDPRIFAETYSYYRMLLVLYRHCTIRDQKNAAPGSAFAKARDLLIRALREKLDANLERIFRLLGLKHVPKDMYNAYLGVVSDQADLRANAVELLDLVLEPSLKRHVIPIVEIKDEATLVRRSNELYQETVPSEYECLNQLLTGDDDWLRTCALFLIAQLKSSEHQDALQRLSNSGNPVVRETARYALQRVPESDSLSTLET